MQHKTNAKKATIRRNVSTQAIETNHFTSIIKFVLQMRADFELSPYDKLWPAINHEMWTWKNLTFDDIF